MVCEWVSVNQLNALRTKTWVSRRRRNSEQDFDINAYLSLKPAGLSFRFQMSQPLRSCELIPCNQSVSPSLHTSPSLPPSPPSLPSSPSSPPPPPSLPLPPSFLFPSFSPSLSGYELCRIYLLIHLSHHFSISIWLA